jgi:hypothetical protein
MNSSLVNLALLAAGALLAGATQAGAAPYSFIDLGATGAAEFLPRNQQLRAGRGIFLPLAQVAPLTTLPSGTARRRPTWHAGKLQPLLWRQQFGTGCGDSELSDYRTRAQPCGMALPEPD